MPPLVAPAPTIVCSSSTKRIGFGAPLERRDERLEALLEVAAKARAGQQRPGVEREDLGAAQRLGGVVAGQALREPLDERGLADAGLADEDGVVLAAAAEHLERAGDLGLAADERVELAGARPLREVDGEGGERVGGRAGRLRARRRAGGCVARAAPARRAGTLATPCEM